MRYCSAKLINYRLDSIIIRNSFGYLSLYIFVSGIKLALIKSRNSRMEVINMALMKWSPSKEVERWFEEFFEEPFQQRAWRRFPSLKKLRELEEIAPAIDMYDNKDEVVVKAEIPGVEKENVHISISDNTLTIKGEMKKEEEVKEKDYYYSERSYGSFARALSLPAKVKADKIKANFKDGILEIHLPKVEEAKPKEIKINVK